MTIPIEEAQTRLGELIDQLPAGEDLILTRDSKPVAKLSRTLQESWPCKAGSAKDKILWIAPLHSKISASTWNEPASRFACDPLVLPGRSATQPGREGRD